MALIKKPEIRRTSKYEYVVLIHESRPQRLSFNGVGFE